MDFHKLELLKALIQSACDTGAISDEDKRYLIKKSKELGLSEEDLGLLVKSEFRRKESAAQMDSNIPSGFMQSHSNENLSSGFVSTGEPLLASRSKKSSIEFTEVSTLDNQGSMSIVQKGKFQGKWVIIKRIKSQFKNNPQYHELFYKEFENAYHLEHPHIVRLIAKGTDTDGAYYFMEYIDGRTLTKYIHQEEKNEEQIKKIILQILDALVYVHKKQIYHRDLKPENILLSYKGDNVKILDFGLAAADSFDDYLAKVGTPKYAAPEQRTKGNSVDQRADIYSFGLIMLEILTKTTKKEELSSVKNPVYQSIIHKCIQPKAAQRFDNCQQIIDLITLNKTVEEKKKPNKKEEPVRKTIPIRETIIIDDEKSSFSLKKLAFAVLLLILISVFIFWQLYPSEMHKMQAQLPSEDATEEYTDEIESELIADEPGYRVTASSELSGGISYSYSPVNVLDRNPETAWAEATRGSGINEWIKIDFEQMTAIWGIKIVNGHALTNENGNQFLANSRVKKAMLEFSQGGFQYVDFQDSDKEQAIKISPVYTTFITITILEVYPGSKTENVCISDIYLITED